MIEEGYGDVEVREPVIQVAGRFLGIVVFLGGIAMLGLAFSLAYQAFNDPNMLISVADLRKVPAPAPASIYVPTLLKLVLLFAMGYIGSLIAGRGAHLFFSAKREVRRGTPGD